MCGFSNKSYPATANSFRGPPRTSDEVEGRLTRTSFTDEGSGAPADANNVSTVIW